MPAIALSGVLDRLEEQRSLDPVIKTLSGLVHDRVPRQTRDLLHGTWLGHPLHPLLTDVTIGTWTSAAVLDLLPGSGRAAKRLIALGIASALPTAASGLVDWAETNRAQQRTGLVHATCNKVGIVLYTSSFLARVRGRTVRGKLLSFAGLGAVMAGGFVGGHLAYRQAQGANHAEDTKSLFPAGWQPLGQLADLPEGQPVARMVAGTTLVVLRRGDQVLALQNKCSHMSGPLSDGQLTDEGGQPCIECPWHGSVFRFGDGEVVHGPATAPQPRFAARLVDGAVEVQLASME